jgi:hypothetical protein
MDPHTTESELPEPGRRVKPTRPVHSLTRPHHVKPIDSSYRLIVRITVWAIAGAVLVGLCIWWMST